MSLITGFSRTRYLKCFFGILILGIISFCILFGISDGTIEDNILTRTIAFPIKILGYPALYLPFENNGITAVLLFLQLLFFPLILERIVFLLKSKNK